MTQPTLPFVRGSDTSKAAADSMAERVTRLEAMVLDVLDCLEDGATDEEIDRCCRLSRTLRPRRVALVRRGLVRDSGRTRVTTSGRRATVWVLA